MAGLASCFAQCQWDMIRCAAAAECFDVVVVGTGLIGAAAAKYLTKSPNIYNVAAVGCRSANVLTNKRIFSSHDDEGRVQQYLGNDSIWSQLNMNSTKVYHDLETKTGIKFHHPVGCLYVSHNPKDRFLNWAPSHIRGGNQY